MNHYKSHPLNALQKALKTLNTSPDLDESIISVASQLEILDNTYSQSQSVTNIQTIKNEITQLLDSINLKTVNMYEDEETSQDFVFTSMNEQ
ncbi:hypothetical protein SS50377_28627 [Spironucleus salmonicida]|uniref:Uncharacterized protein n=1 Tax=Spironucleus salmonicida TaxID=348837 RepID=A0A9P8LKI1_9EUKA|nr:hypothetical protein SS50377_28627 [Spironucleus salmonicida]